MLAFYCLLVINDLIRSRTLHYSVSTLVFSIQYFQYISVYQSVCRTSFNFHTHKKCSKIIIYCKQYINGFRHLENMQHCGNPSLLWSFAVMYCSMCYMNYSVIAGVKRQTSLHILTQMCLWLKALAQKGLECIEGC